MVNNKKQIVVVEDDTALLPMITYNLEKNGFSVVRDFCGHGISNTFHESPNILHYGKKI